MATILVNQKDRTWTISATGGAASLPVVLVPAGNKAFVSSMVWVASGATSGQGCIVQNNPPSPGTANNVFEEYATTTNYSQEPSPAYNNWLGKVTDGLQVTKLDNGTLYVDIR